MSTKYKTELLNCSHDAELRSILRHTSMPGKMALSFQREPSFFAAEHAGNLASQVIGMRDTESGTLAGFGARGFRQGFINGEVATTAYLSGLRTLPEVRGGTLLARAYRYLRQLHADSRVPYSFTTILDDNERAKAILTSGRAGLPVYRPLGRFITYLLPLYRGKSAAKCDSCGEKIDADAALDSAIERMNLFNRQYQFSPHYSAADFTGRSGLLPGFDPANLYVCRRDTEVTATVGVWDQTSFKQSVVTDYSTLYRLAQPLSNVGASFGWSAKLPRIGQALPYLYASFLSHAPSRSADLVCLIRQVVAEWSQRGFAYLLAGLHEKHPLAGELNKLSAMHLSSTIYLVFWPDLIRNALPSENRIPHLEIATL